MVPHFSTALLPLLLLDLVFCINGSACDLTLKIVQGWEPESQGYSVFLCAIRC